MRFTRVVLLILALCIGGGFFQLGKYLLEDVDAQTFQATEEVMVDAAHVLAGVIEAELARADPDGGELKAGGLRRAFDLAHGHPIRARIYAHTKTEIGLNAYMVGRDGVVVFDSEGGRREGRDFSDFNDVKLTLAGKYGARSTREDESDANSSVLYVAAPVRAVAEDGERGEIVGVVTVYKQQSDVLAFITGRQDDILTATLFIGGGIVLFTGAVFIWLFRPIGRLTRYAQSISQGERLPLPHLGKGREVNTLGKALCDMKETLEGRRYVENYVSSLTHELKSPLAAIRGAVELLDEEMPTAQRHRFLENIRRETDRSEVLVRDLLQLAELEGKGHLEQRRSFDLSALCRQMASEYEARWRQSGVMLELDIESGVEITGDEMVLRMAIGNLLENAIGFASEGERVTFGLRRMDGRVELRVEDEGPGVPGYALGRVFEHFYSLPRPGSAYKGTGLGLPLVMEAAQLHGGTAELRNRERAGEVEGCCAILSLPSDEIVE